MTGSDHAHQVTEVMLCLQCYNCKFEKVFSGQIYNIIKSQITHSTDCSHVSDIITARDDLLALPEWYTRDHIADLISSECVLQYEQRVLLALVSISHFLYFVLFVRF